MTSFAEAFSKQLAPKLLETVRRGQLIAAGCSLNPLEGSVAVCVVSDL